MNIYDHFIEELLPELKGFYGLCSCFMNILILDEYIDFEISKNSIKESIDIIMQVFKVFIMP